MPFSWETIAVALESPLASTIYALLVLLLLYFARQRLLNLTRPAPVRIIAITLGILIVLRVVETFVFGAAWFGDQLAIRLMPPLERTLYMLTILAIGWLWTQQIEQKGNRQLLFGLTLVTVLVISIGMILFWMDSPLTSFNYTVLDYLWSGACAIVLYVAWSDMVTRMHNGRGAQRWRLFIHWKTLGSIMFSILLFGQLAHILFAEPYGNMPLVTQVATLVSVPILFKLPVPSPARSKFSDPVEVEADQSTLKSEAGEFSDSFHAAAAILAQKMAEDYGADVCAFIYMQAANTEVTIEVTYNLLRDVRVDPTMIESKQVPNLSTALQAGKTLRLSADGQLAELGVLADALRLSSFASLLAVPLPGVSSLSRWGILLLSRKDIWQLEDEVRLEKQAPELSGMLAVIAGTPAEL